MPIPCGDAGTADITSANAKLAFAQPRIVKTCLTCLDLAALADQVWMRHE